MKNVVFYILYLFFNIPGQVKSVKIKRTKSPPDRLYIHDSQNHCFFFINDNYVLF